MFPSPWVSDIPLSLLQPTTHSQSHGNFQLDSRVINPSCYFNLLHKARHQELIPIHFKKKKKSTAGSGFPHPLLFYLPFLVSKTVNLPLLEAENLVSKAVYFNCWNKLGPPMLWVGHYSKADMKTL